MSSETEKMLSNALKVFNEKLCERQVIKLEGMEDYLKVPQYKALVNLEKRATQIEVDAVMRIMDSKIAYLKAANELRACESRWLAEIKHGMESLEERNRIVKDVNQKMRKGDYSMLHPAQSVAAPQSSPRTARNPAVKQPIPRRLEAAMPAREESKSKVEKPELTDIKRRLAILNMDATPRSPLGPITVNKTVKITPKSGPIVSSKGSLDGSVVAMRAPTTPLSSSKWDVPAPNFDETIDAEPSNPLLRGAGGTHRPLPTALLRTPEEEEADDTFPLVQPSLPFQTPTVPHSRPFLLSSMRSTTKETAKEDPVSSSRPAPTPVSTLPVRPVPTPLSSRPTSTSGDPLSSLGLMKLQRPVLNSEIGKKLMGQL